MAADLSAGGRRRLLGSFLTMLKRISKRDLAHAVKLFSRTFLIGWKTFSLR